MPVRSERIRDLRTGTIGPDLPDGASGPVLYWINRERRVRDNWALIYAIESQIALGGQPSDVRVFFCLPPNFLAASLRQYDFLVRGLEELERDLAKLGITFNLLLGDPEEEVALHIHQHQPSLVVTDLEPIRLKRHWLDIVLQDTVAPFHQVDAHNIVPVWIASDKLEYTAATLRPKITRLLPTYLEPFPELPPSGHKPVRPTTNWAAVRETFTVDPTVPPVDWVQPGEAAGRTALGAFLGRLSTYANRNDPTRPGQSDLSPYLHFGQLSPQRAALDTLKALGLRADQIGDIRSVADGFLEELIIRRELSDNFTHYNLQYDQFDGFPAWAQQTLNEHRDDPRDHLYSYEQWEHAQTHDALWNAAQRQLVATGKMHGYMRMYWAKKILEWSASPEEAQATAIVLNDKYSLDGRDPNGYVGVAWSIGGVHDRAWTERKVFGKIRYMNESGCRRKFDVDAYIAAQPPLP